MALALFFGAQGCSSAVDDHQRDGAGPPDSDQRATAQDQGFEAQVRADTTPLQGAARFAGLWGKEKTGAALIVSNDCGTYWRLDFDYAYNQLTVTSPEALLLHHCVDAVCAETDSSTSTLTVQGNSAVEEQSSDITMEGCTIETVSSTTWTLETSVRGLVQWRGALTYVGDGCEAIKPPETRGDSCEALAETAVNRVE